MSTQQTQQGCDACNKSGLSLLLLRPSPIAKDAKLAPLGANALISADGVTEGLVPARKPTESRTVLRLLREGFVHVYIPSPPPGMKSWLIYRVTPNADLIAESNPVFSQMPQPPACGRDGHNAAGMRLLHIPQAHKISTIWVAYSANLWSEKLKGQNAANAKAMQQVSLQSCGRNSFMPTVAALKSQVLECALTSIKAKGAEASPTKGDQDFPFVSLAAETQSLVDNLQRAAACHPKTRGLEVAVVLRDAVGFAAELNAIRLRRNELAKQAIKDELAKPENAWAFNSSRTLMDLKALYEDTEFAKALDKWAPPATWREYLDPRPITPLNPMGNTLAPARWKGGTWEALPDEKHARQRVLDSTLGRVWYPTSGSRAVEEGQQRAKSVWGDLEDEFDEAGRKKWHIDFDTRMTQAHLDTLARYEDDWWGARQDAQFNDYFAQHFDESDPNKPNALHCPGLIYAAEVHCALTPQPFTSGGVLSAYLSELTADPTQPSAVMLRSLVANQGEVIAKIKGVMWADAAVDHAHGNRNDKLYDLSMALVLGAANAKNPNAVQKAIVKYGWLSSALGNALGGYALAAVNSLSAAHSAAVMAKVAAGSLALVASRLAGASLVQRATDLALQSIVTNTSLNTPLQITKRFQAGRGLFLLTRGGHFTNAQAKGFIRDGHIDITLHTDSHEMGKVAGDMDQALLEGPGAGTARTPGTKTAALLTSPAGLASVALSEAKFAELYAKGGTQWGDLMNKVKAGYGQMDRFTKAGTIMRSLEGRLALGVILLNFKGALDALQKLDDPTLKELARLEAKLSLTDGVSSVFAAGLQLHEIVVKSGLERKLGANGAVVMVEKLASVHGMRAAGFTLGAVAGVANAWGAWIKVDRALEDSHRLPAAAYFASFGAFVGMSGVFVLQTGGALAERALAKGITNDVLRRVAVRVAARYGAAGVVGLTGWGTALLALAVLFEVGAVAMTPTEMETWASRTRFGKAGKKKFASWEEEEAALLAMFDKPKDPAATPYKNPAVPPAAAAGAPSA